MRTVPDLTFTSCKQLLVGLVALSSIKARRWCGRMHLTPAQSSQVSLSSPAGTVHHEISAADNLPGPSIHSPTMSSDALNFDEIQGDIL